jgi:hypothetical protein
MKVEKIKEISFAIVMISLFCLFIIYKVIVENPSNTPTKVIIPEEGTPIDDFGFIITRHVNSATSNQYWIHCIRCIRNHYKNKIVVIDDNSNPNYLKNPNEKFANVTIVNTEYPGRGELLGYYYLYKNMYFKKAMIIHDSLFVKQYIDISNIHDCKFVFHCNKHTWDNDTEIVQCLKVLNNPETLIEEYYKKQNWYLCFGVQSVITWEFLNRIQLKHNFFKLINCIINREKRMALERIFGFICTLEKSSLLKDPSIFGDIHSYMVFGYTYNQYIHDMSKMYLGNINARRKMGHLKVIKVWTGR